jgi:hypothetical protein
MNVLLSTTYFGPVQWYQKLCRADKVWIEACESFQKQTYRNRCVIATTQGCQALTVPVERGESPLIRDVRISDHGNWRHLHWNALRSAYGESPFFEYYEDDLRPFFERRWTFLLDFNEEIRLKMCELLDVRPNVGYTQDYVRSTVDHDFRNGIQPKHPAEDATFLPRPYYQVYSQKHGFLPNLSILDLLMNMGPEGIFYLV